MRMLIPFMIIVLGMLSGAFICHLFKNTATSFKAGLIAGGIGAFAGLMVRDVLDIVAGGAVFGSLVAAVGGAVLFSIITNLIYTKMDREP